MSEPLHYQPLMSVAQQLRSKELSARALTEHMLTRISRLDNELLSYATVTPELARAQAQRAEEEIQAGRYRGFLHGVPVAIKDLCCTAGIRTMGGLKVRQQFVPEFNATVVQKLEDAGAVLLGKLNLTEGALSAYNPEFPIPKNPWEKSCGRACLLPARAWRWRQVSVSPLSAPIPAALYAIQPWPTV